MTQMTQVCACCACRGNAGRRLTAVSIKRAIFVAIERTRAAVTLELRASFSRGRSDGSSRGAGIDWDGDFWVHPNEGVTQVTQPVETEIDVLRITGPRVLLESGWPRSHSYGSDWCATWLLKTRMTGLEPATSGVTGRCSNQLSYIPKADSSLRLIFAVSGLWAIVARSVRIPRRSPLDGLIVTGTRRGFNRDAKRPSGNSQSNDMTPQCGFLFERRLRLHPQIVSPMPRETAVLPGE